MNRDFDDAVETGAKVIAVVVASPLIVFMAVMLALAWVIGRAARLLRAVRP